MTWPARSPRAPRPPGGLGPPGWCRLYNGCADHPKWRRIAADAEARVGDVIATVMKLMEVANRGRPRGSLADFSPVEWALSLQVERPVIDRIWTALEAVGWVDQDWLTTWDERQREREDATTTKRSREYRARKKTERLREQGLGPVENSTPSTVTNRDRHAVTAVTVTSVTARPLIRKDESMVRHAVTSVTSRSDQTRVEREEAGDEEREKSWRPEPDARAWLFGRGDHAQAAGLQMVERFGGRHPDVAAGTIRRWLQSVDADTLAAIIHAIGEQGASGEAFFGLIETGIATAIERASGQTSLRLPAVHKGGAA